MVGAFEMDFFSAMSREKSFRRRHWIRHGSRMETETLAEKPTPWLLRRAGGTGGRHEHRRNRH